MTGKRRLRDDCCPLRSAECTHSLTTSSSLLSLLLPFFLNLLSFKLLFSLFPPWELNKSAPMTDGCQWLPLSHRGQEPSPAVELLSPTGNKNPPHRSRPILWRKVKKIYLMRMIKNRWNEWVQSNGGGGETQLLLTLPELCWRKWIIKLQWNMDQMSRGKWMEKKALAE